MSTQFYSLDEAAKRAIAEAQNEEFNFLSLMVDQLRMKHGYDYQATVELFAKHGMNADDFEAAMYTIDTLEAQE